MKKFVKIYDYEDRLVRFAGESAIFSEKLPNTYTANYYKNQLIRSSGSPVLRACWEFVFGGKKDVFFGLIMSNFLVIAFVIANKFDEIRPKKTLF